MKHVAIQSFQVLCDDGEEIVVWALDENGRLWEFRCLTCEAAEASCDPEALGLPTGVAVPNGRGMKTTTLKSIGPPYFLVRVRRQRCKTTGCAERSRMALVAPLSDVGEDGGPGLGAIVQCGAHLEEALVRLTDYDRKEARA